MQEELYLRFSPKMYAVCLRYASNVEDAQDLLQEGFIKVYRNLHHFRAEGSFEGWIRRVFVNTSIEHFRKKSTKLSMVTEKEEGTIEARLPDLEFPSAQDFIDKPVLLGIRPENIRVTELPKPPAKYSGIFPALVDLVEPVGSEAIIHLHTGVHKLLSRSRLLMDQRDSGHRLRFEIDVKKVHLFDPVSMRRIGPRT